MREAISLRLKKLYAENPEMKQRVIDGMVRNNPKWIEKLMLMKELWKKEKPAEYKCAEAKRLARMRSSGHREKMRQAMRKYFAERPEEMSRLIDQGAGYWKGNEVAIEDARRRAIENKSHESILRWMAEEPERYKEKCARHSVVFKQWYVDNPEKAKRMAEGRNEVLRGESHREKMSYKTSEYMRANPDVAASRQLKMLESIEAKKRTKDRCMDLVRDKLVESGEIEYQEVTYNRVTRWKRMGLLAKYFPTLPGSRAKVEMWEEFLRSV